MERELRSIKAPNLEVRSTSKGKTITGYAIRFGEPADIGEFTEVVSPSAVTRTLRDDDQVALWNHDSNSPIGRKSMGTLKLTADSKGVRFECSLPSSPLGENVYESISRGDVQGTSFGFVVDPNGDKWAQDSNGKLVRTLTSITVFEISPTPFPAYPTTSVDARAVRSALDLRKKKKDDLDDDFDEDNDDDSDDDDSDEDEEEDRCLAMRAAEQCECGKRDCLSTRSGDDEEDRAHRLELLARRY